MPAFNSMAGFITAGPDEASRPAVRFLVALGRALHDTGVSAHRIEETLLLAADRLGVLLHVFTLPTGMFLSFGERENAATVLVRLQPGTTDLERVTLLDAVADDVIDGRLDPTRGADAIARILMAPPRWGRFASTAAYGASSGAFSVFLGGGPAELMLSVGIGLLIGLLALAARRVASLARLFEFAAAMTASFAAAAADALFGPVSLSVVVTSGLIMLMPGMAVVGGLNELANKHLASGTARLAGAAVVLLALMFGTALGGRLGMLLPGRDAPPILAEPAEGDRLPPWATVPALAAAAVAFGILYNARPDQFLPILCASTLAIIGTVAGTRLLGAQLGLFVAGMLVGSSSNLYARLLRRPAIVPLIPGLALLVPGVVGYRSLSALLDHQALTGIEIAFDMTVKATALVAGLLFSNSLVPPRRTV